MEKASVKHLEFQLQREKALTKDLDAKCKALSAQVAQLEQDKAELRREKLVLGEEAKKTSKLDDRIHNLQREVENRDAIITAERAAAQEARAEAEEIRRNANASIALWTKAEEQWTLEQTALNEAASLYRSKIEELEKESRLLSDARAELTRQLQRERERAMRLAETRERMDVEVKTLHSQVEKLQNKVCDLEQTVYKLDLAGEKQCEAINLKDTEIKTLEATVARHVEAEERLEQTINSLNDRINAAKMVNLEGKCENEKLQCDVLDAKKEIDRLNLQIDSLKRDSNFLSQSQVSVQKALDELKEKHRQLQEELRDKNVEIRRHELSISQLNMELKKSENQGGEWSFQFSSLESELQRTKEALKAASAGAEELGREKAELMERLKELRQLVESKEEEMVLLQSESDERADTFAREIKDLEKEIEARQAVIKELSDQLNSASEKNTVYHSKILEEAEASEKMRQQLTQMELRVQWNEQEVFLQMCVSEKEKIFSAFLSDWYEAPKGLVATLLRRCDCLQEEWCALRKEAEELSCEKGTKDTQLRKLLRRSAELEDQVATLQRKADLEAERMSVLKDEGLAAKNEVNELRAVLESLRGESASASSMVAALREQLVSAKIEFEREEAAAADLRARMCALSEGASTLEEAVFSYAMAQMDGVQELLAQKVDVIRLQVASLLSESVAEKSLLQSSKEQVEATCRELSVLVREAKISMNKSDLAAVERQKALTSRVALLESQLAGTRREKEQAVTQLAALLRRFEEDKTSFDLFRREAADDVQNERARSEAAVKESVKLRKAIDAEVKRKCEYKEALENLKKLRCESEELRRVEKERAADAIRKANAEANYWVRCFDHLKEMIEKSRRTGGRLPSIDADTIQRLEVAKTAILPIQTCEVNSALSGLPKLKRVREESSGDQR
ncbi:hypothetical protein LSCM1_07677 [Leishmania martiniquensis]|uniref:Uncharacterized protein n=1 Tax=Leishmania martiniquensis TaxID=1580590 RepID=A0A836KXZ3_9TRYP|nr:hypothetical protein LSCM1_07677 [Leishmania martiniquensis]